MFVAIWKSWPNTPPSSKSSSSPLARRATKRYGVPSPSPSLEGGGPSGFEGRDAFLGFETDPEVLVEPAHDHLLL